MTWAKPERVLNDSYNLGVELQHVFGSERFRMYCKGKKVLRLNAAMKPLKHLSAACFDTSVPAMPMAMPMAACNKTQRT